MATHATYGILPTLSFRQGPTLHMSPRVSCFTSCFTSIYQHSIDGESAIRSFGAHACFDDNAAARDAASTFQ